MWDPAGCSYSPIGAKRGIGQKRALGKVFPMDFPYRAPCSAHLDKADETGESYCYFNPIFNR